jgi:hypothetical protein
VAAALCFLGGKRYKAAWQAAEIRAIRDQQFELVGLVEHILLELLRQGRQFRIDFAQTCLCIRLEIRARAHELLVGFLEQALLFGAQVQLVAHAEDGVDTLEQRRVQEDVVPVCGKFRRDGFSSVTDDVIGMGAIHREEHAPDSVECAATDLECHERVIESRGVGVRNDCIDLRLLPLYAVTHGGQVVGGFDKVEGWYTERRVPLGEQRVFAFGAGCRFVHRFNRRRRA